MSLSMDNFSPQPPQPMSTKLRPSFMDRDRLMKAIRLETRTARLTDSARNRLMQKRIGKSDFDLMDTRELKRALRTLRERNGTQQRNTYRTRSAPPIAKIRALYWTLYYFGVVKHHDDWAMAEFLRQNFGVEDQKTLSNEQSLKITAQLMAKATECGVQWPQLADGREPGLGERRAVCLALWAKCAEAGLCESPMEDAMLRKGRDLDLPQHAHHYSIKQWDKLLRHLGMRLRTHLDLTNPDEAF